jgi:cold shock CspA family protein/uncharacterized LabA/DUF88 family protein
MNGSGVKLLRIGIFYDGNYFNHVSNYYNYAHPRKSRLSISGLHEFIRSHVSQYESSDLRYSQVVDAHYFRGRLTAHEANARQRLLNERIFEDVLMKEGIVTHYLPTGRMGEKGIDVWLALEALELTIHKRFDVLALIACDGDYVPLVRKLNTLGTRVMVLGWDFEYTDDNGNERSTTTSIKLLDEVTYPVLMHTLIDDKTRRNDPIINSLFVAPEESTRTRLEISPDQAKISLTSPDPNRRRGRIIQLKTGYGFIETDTPGRNLFFYWGDLMDVDFNELKIGDVIEYEIGANERGECAKQLTRVLA